MSDEENEEWGEVETTAVIPMWRFSPWDIIGIGFQSAGAILNSAAQGAILVAQECSAMANYSRRRFDERAEKVAEQEIREGINNSMRSILALDVVEPERRPGDC